MTPNANEEYYSGFAVFSDKHPAYYIDAFSNTGSYNNYINGRGTYVDLNVGLSTGLSDGYLATSNLVSNVNTPD